MCIEVFDLVVWEPLLPLASSQSLSTLDGHTSPLRLARKLRSYLGATADEYKTLDDWARRTCSPANIASSLAADALAVADIGERFVGRRSRIGSI